MFFKKDKSGEILLPVDGKIIELGEVPDKVFSDKLLGDGAAVMPEKNVITSPVSGKIVQVFDTKHAYTITSDDGLEILIHIGLNTVELKGEGFEALVKEGDRVAAGDKLAIVNLEDIAERGYMLYTPVVITNMERIKSFEVCKDTTTSKNAMIKYKLK